MPPTAPSPPPAPAAPPGFRIARQLKVGRYHLLVVFPGLERLAAAARLEPNPALRTRLFDDTCVEIVDEDMWMYVAPHEVPKGARRGWKPVVAPGQDCIVVGLRHLRESPAIMLFMDIYHEVFHVRQRRDGANLWETGVSYVRRWTEVDAYRFVVDEARSLGVSNEFLRDYLRVEWISEAEHSELLAALHVPVR